MMAGWWWYIATTMILTLLGGRNSTLQTYEQENDKRCRVERRWFELLSMQLKIVRIDLLQLQCANFIDIIFFM